MALGKVMIFMGDGYGKSAAALGVAMKRASDNDRIVIIQFLKGKGITDSQFTKRLEPEIKIFRFEKSEIDYNDRTPEEQEEAAVNIKNGLNFARKVLATGECNLLILDEVLEVVNKNIISVDDLKELVESRVDTDFKHTQRQRQECDPALFLRGILLGENFRGVIKAVEVI